MDGDRGGKNLMESWQQILADCGYPTEILTVDFESYFDDEYHFRKDAADAVGLSTIEYINDPRWGLTGLGVGASVNYFWDPEHLETRLREIPIDEYTVVIQNSRFDITILQTKFGIVPKYIIDIKDLHAHYDASASHKLKDMAKEFGLQAKGETQDFKGLHYASMTDEQRKALQEYCLNDVDLETKLFKILLPKLSNPAFELRLQRHTLDMWLHRGFDFDRDLADSLKVQMYALTIEAVNKTGLVDENYGRLYNKYFWDGKKIPKKFDGKSDAAVEIMIRKEAREAAATDLRGDTFVKLLQVQGEQVEWKAGKRGNIAALAKTDDYAKSLMVHGNLIVRDLMTARQAVKSWPLHTKRITSMEKQSAANGGILRTPLNYYGGHTGRWSGGEGINLQNLGGKSATIDPLIGKIRGLLRTPAGFTLGIGDSAQIEARVLAWLAGQDDLTLAFADGKDVYSEFAAILFRTPVRKERKTDPLIVYLILMIKRAFGKKSILGLGYGMGVDKFYQQCLQDSSLRSAFDSGQYNRQFIQRAVDTYRTRYAKIPAYWRSVETAFKQALRFPHLHPTVGQIEFSCIGHEVQIKLPSGRILYYRQCSVKNGGNISYLAGPKRESLWGGSLCLAGHTEVLTDSGFLFLQNIHPQDKVWDGSKWVPHSGLMYKGEQSVIGLNGIDLTREHKIMSNTGWVYAAKAQGLTWAKVWGPNSVREPGVEREELGMAGSLSVWERICHAWKRLNQKTWNTFMPSMFLAQKRKESNARHDPASCLLGLAFYVRQMRIAFTPGIEKLWRAWDTGMSAVERIIFMLLGGYEERLCSGASVRPYKQQRKLRTGKLPVGDLCTTGQQQTRESEFSREYPSVVERNGHWSNDTILQTPPRASVAPVFDLMNCGDNNCFTVKDGQGKLRLVHNCENIVQSVARDLLGFWILACEDAGLPVILSVHDEVVCQINKNNSKISLDKLEQILYSIPEWASGLPVAAEVKESSVYCK
jgi:DNA polymerase